MLWTLRKVTIATKCASVDEMNNLLHLQQSATSLRLVLEETYYWLAIADKIRQVRCKIQRLTLVLYRKARSGATEDLKAVASAIRLIRNLEHLVLERIEDEAGTAVAEA
jgi:hypothetical protein